MEKKFIKTLSILLLIWGSFQFLSQWNLSTERLAVDPNHNKKSDLFLCIGMAFLFMLCRMHLTSAGTKVFEFLFGKQDLSESLLNKKGHKFGSSLFKVFFFTTSSILGFIVLQSDTVVVEGIHSLNFERIFWSENPKVSLAVKLYYLSQLGYQLHVFLYELCSTKKPEMAQTLLQHIVISFLLTLVYFANFVRIGAVAIFIHNTTDVLVYACKLFLESKKKIILSTLYTALCINWFVGRLVLFPKYIILPLLKMPSNHSQELTTGKYFFSACLLVMVMLHSYWMVVILKAGREFYLSGNPCDVNVNFGTDVEIEGKKAQKGYSCNTNEIIEASNKIKSN